MSQAAIILIFASLMLAAILLYVVCVLVILPWRLKKRGVVPSKKKRPTTVCDEGGCDVRSQSSDRQAE